MTEYTVTNFTKAVGPEDFEETTLIEQWCSLMKQAESLRLAFGKVDKATLSKLEVDIDSVVKSLGYDPQVGRPARPRGRIRNIAMPKPLPDAGTELLSCLGHAYKVLGYAQTPTSSSVNIIIYRDHLSRTVARSTAHLFAGSLATDEPFVTWPEDPRKLKPNEAVPLNKRRSLSKRDLAKGEHADPEAAGNWVKPAGRY